MAVQVNDTVNVLHKTTGLLLSWQQQLSFTISYVSLVRNDEILHNMGVCLYCLFTDTLDQVSLTSSISGRNACPSEEVTFTCTAQTTAVFWGYEGFGERTMHYTSPPSRGDFRAEIVSYDRNQSCLVSSLSFRATTSRNGTVTCTSRDRSSSQSLSLHIMSSEFLGSVQLQLNCRYLLMNYLAQPVSYS